MEAERESQSGIGAAIARIISRKAGRDGHAPRPARFRLAEMVNAGKPL